MPPIDYNDPWLIERSRTMCAEMGRVAASERLDVMDRHVAMVRVERPALGGDVAGLDALSLAMLFAAPLDDSPLLTAAMFRASTILRPADLMLTPPESV